MKSPFNKLFLACSLAFMTACGGGGGSSDDGSSLAEVDADAVDTLGGNLARATPGCDYTSDTVATGASDPAEIIAYRALVTSIKQNSTAARNSARESDYTDTITGDCGGTVDISGEHDAGDDDLTVSFSNFCTGETTGDNAVANGTISIFVDGTSTESGPEVEALGISTGSSGVTVVSTVEGETSNNSLFIDDLDVQIDDPNEPSNITIDADEIAVTDAGDEFRVTNMSMAINDASGSPTMTINGVTYYDPEIGAVKVSSTGLPLDPEVSAPATITVSGADGSSATFYSDDVSTGMFIARDADGNSLGALDCSGLAGGV